MKILIPLMFSLAAAAPLAAELPATYSHTVAIADLDLASSAGQRTFEQRLALAARDVCGTASDVDIAGKNDVRRCRDDVIARGKLQGRSILANARGTSVTVAAR